MSRLGTDLGSSFCFSFSVFLFFCFPLFSLPFFTFFLKWKIPVFQHFGIFYMDWPSPLPPSQPIRELTAVYMGGVEIICRAGISRDFIPHWPSFIDTTLLPPHPAIFKYACRKLHNIYLHTWCTQVLICLFPLEDIPQGGYFGFQVTGMIKGFFWVWNFRFWDFFR